MALRNSKNNMDELLDDDDDVNNEPPPPTPTDTALNDYDRFDNSDFDGENEDKKSQPKLPDPTIPRHQNQSKRNAPVPTPRQLRKAKVDTKVDSDELNPFEQSTEFNYKQKQREQGK